MQCAVMAVAVILVISRRPDLVMHAHFYAEDGAVWYADAYNLGWVHALTLTAGGYLNTLQRLVGALSLLVPIRYAPLVMNVCGVAVQVLPVFFLLSRRCAHWWPLRIRLWQAALYVFLPNSRETHILLTNAPFHLALLVFLVALAASPPNWRWKIFDIAVLVISPLSGPFCIFLLPLVAVFWWRRRQSWTVVAMAVLVPLVALQAAELLFGGFSRRAPGQLGATPMLFFRLLSGHVYMGSVWGENNFAVNAHGVRVLLVMVVGTCIVGFALWRAGLELRIFIVFAMLLLGAALSKPLIAGPLPLWQLLALDRSARYWFFPMLAVLWSLLFCATQKQNKMFRIGGMVAFVALLHGIVHDRRYPPFPNQQFQSFLERFDAAASGTLVAVPDPPPNGIAYLKKK